MADRAQTPGVTAVIGRAQMGKSWVLTEVARQLAERSFLVGYTECGEPMDLFRRSVADLYARWFSDSSWHEQARMVWGQQSEDLVVKAGTTVGSLFKSLSRLLGTPGESAGDLVKAAFNAMASAQHVLQSGGLEMKRLESEQVCALLDSVHRISSRPMLLIFDQWEQSPSIEAESKLLGAFRRRIDEWPPCHILIGTQREAGAWSALDNLRAGAPKGMIELFDLPRMHLDESSVQQGLLSFIRERAAIANSVEDGWLLDRIDRNPAVVYRWVGAHPGALTSIEALDSAAREAHAYGYRELTNVLQVLPDPERLLAMRFALLPSTPDVARWKPLKSAVLDAVKPGTLDNLRDKRVLETGSVPAFGHPKRAEAALRWFKQYREEELGLVASDFSLSLAEKLQRLIPEEEPFAACLAGLRVEGIETSTFANVLRIMSRHLCGFDPPAPEEVIQAARALGSDESLAPGAVLLAWGLDDAMKHAQEGNRQHLRNLLLEELRQLANRYSHKAAVPEQLARALFRVLESAREACDSNQRDQLLAELKTLKAAYPGEPGVRQMLAMGLNNALFAHGNEGLLDRCERLLDELRQLSAQYPSDPEVQGPFARALNNTLFNSNDPMRDDALVSELRRLYNGNPSHSVVRDRFSTALLICLNRPQAENWIPQANELLRDLRQLSADDPPNEKLRANLGKGLGAVFNYARENNDFDRSDEVLAGLRQLSQAHPDDVPATEQFSAALALTFVGVKNQGETARCASLLGEMRKLSATHTDVEVRLRFARMLRLASVDPCPIVMPDTHQTPLEELASLSTADSGDAAIREVFAEALADALGDEREQTNFDLQQRLLQRLRDLSQLYPDETGVRVQFALGLFRIVRRSSQASLMNYRECLVDELRELTKLHPDDSAVREYRFKVLVGALLDALAENATPQRESQLEEVRQLAAVNMNDPAARGWLVRALACSFAHGHKRNEHSRCTEFSNELSQLAKEYPNDPWVPEITRLFGSSSL